MKLFVGLGNPGKKYKNNRHNVGLMMIDALASKILNSKSQILNKSKIKIFKSKTFVNNSGRFVKHLISQYPSIPVSSIYIIHDDLDLPLGTWKIQLAKGPKDHGGINDIEQKLGTKNFTRIRIGVDNRKPEERKPSVAKAMDGREYVLQDFTKEERKILEGVIKQICKKLATL